MENAGMTYFPAETSEDQPAPSSAQPPYAPAAEANPVATEPSPAAVGPADADEETDVWWGSFSGRTMAPSWVVCVLLTALIAWGAWALVPRAYVQGTILGLGGALWLVQLARWGHRIFGYNYRLTTRRLFRDRGFLYKGFAALELTAVSRVLVKRSWSDRLVDVGQIWILPEEKTKEPLVLDGVRKPLVVAELFRRQVQAVRARQQGAGPG
jgi:hypothetical protein